MKLYKLSFALDHSIEMINAVETDGIQVIGRIDQPPIIMLRLDQLFEPDRNKWVLVKLEIPDELFQWLVTLAKDKDISINDLFVLAFFEYIAWRRLEDLRKSNNEPNVPGNE